MALFEITNDESGLKEAVESTNLRIIVDAEGGKSLLVFKNPHRGRIIATDDPASLFGQQDSGLLDLGMIYLTEKQTGKNIILFSHNLEGIGVVQERDAAGAVIGSKLIQEGAAKDYIVDELIANIYAQQKAAVNLGMLSVTRLSDNEPLIVMDKYVHYIAEETTGPTNSKIVFKDSAKDLWVVEGVTAIVGSQSK